MPCFLPPLYGLGSKSGSCTLDDGDDALAVEFADGVACRCTKVTSTKSATSRSLFPRLAAPRARALIGFLPGKK